MGTRERLVRKALLGRRGQQDHRDLQVLMEPIALWQDPLAHRVLLVPKGLQVLMVLIALSQDPLDPKALLVPKDPKVQQDHRDLQVLMVQMVTTVLLGQQDHRGPKVRQDLQGLMAQMVLLGQQDHRDPKALLAHRVLLGLQGLMVPTETTVLLERQALKALQDHRERQGLLAHRDLKALQGLTVRPTRTQITAERSHRQAMVLQSLLTTLSMRPT